ncbi:hypothetical protein EDB81DRAFT_751652 [Dactylonectria macrodidyma]|uniref:Uncharacterized protein n=1 Tax=Dactylonectria macrodidyma TaxID=307937 RepID=A0A9P9FU52_9HYPO|nr:hypothetical protein EDB81DRAFT_751652 [Dactylonectria macrodidyma]
MWIGLMAKIACVSDRAGNMGGILPQVLEVLQQAFLSAILGRHGSFLPPPSSRYLLRYEGRSDQVASLSPSFDALVRKAADAVASPRTVCIVKVVIPDSRTAVTERPFLNGKPTVPKAVWALRCFHEERKRIPLKRRLLHKGLGLRPWPSVVALDRLSLTSQSHHDIDGLNSPLEYLIVGQIGWSANHWSVRTNYDWSLGSPVDRIFVTIIMGGEYQALVVAAIPCRRSAQEFKNSPYTVRQHVQTSQKLWGMTTGVRRVSVATSFHQIVMPGLKGQFMMNMLKGKVTRKRGIK